MGNDFQRMMFRELITSSMKIQKYAKNEQRYSLKSSKTILKKYQVH